MKKIADKFAVMKDGSEKTALALDLFGRAGAKLIPMLNEGSAGISELQEEARALGIVLGKEDLKAAELTSMRSKEDYMPDWNH